MNLWPIRNELKRLSYFLRTGYYSRGERVNPDFPDENFENHFKVYKFARQFAVGKDVLDVGCGTGYGTAHLAEVAKRAIGIDISDSALKLARGRYPGLDFRRMDAMDLCFPDESFDLIVSTENFEHLPDQNAHVERLAKVLRKDGMCFIATPNPELTYCPNRFHTHEFTYSELRDILGKCFESVVILETQLLPSSKEGQEARAKRLAAGEVGVTRIDADCTYLSNTHSFFAFCTRPR